VRDVAGNDERASKREARGNGMLRKVGADVRHGTVEVDLHDLGGIGMLTRVSRNEASGILLELLNPDTVLIDFGLGVAIRGTGDGEADWTRGTVTR